MKELLIAKLEALKTYAIVGAACFVAGLLVHWIF